MKIIRFIVSFMLILGMLILVVWAAIRTNDQTCKGISITIHAAEKTELITESDVLSILKENKAEWEGRKMKDIDLSLINKILTQENYIKSVDKVHFSGSKMQIEITLHNILLEILLKDDKKFLLDDQGVYLPYTPKVGNGVMIASGIIPNTFRKNEAVSPANEELYGVFVVATLIKSDPTYAAWFEKMYINEKQEITLYPTSCQIPVLFGTMQNAEKKLEALKYMYKEVLPYVEKGKYAQLDVRFQNRIVAAKSKS